MFDAIKAGDVDGVRALVAATPALAQARDYRGLSALMLALYRGQAEIVPILLAADPPLDIFEAAGLGRSERVAELLRQDAGLISARSVDGFTPLHIAAYWGHEAAGAVLLDHGADVNAVSDNAMNVQPLHSATAGRHRGMASLLLKAGADVNARQSGGWAPLQASVLNDDAATTRLLLAHGADPAQPAEDGRNALDMAAERGDPRILALLNRGGMSSKAGYARRFSSIRASVPPGSYAFPG